MICCATYLNKRSTAPTLGFNFIQLITFRLSLGCTHKNLLTIALSSSGLISTLRLGYLWLWLTNCLVTQNAISFTFKSCSLSKKSFLLSASSCLLSNNSYWLSEIVFWVTNNYFSLTKNNFLLSRVASSLPKHLLLLSKINNWLSKNSN